MRSNAELLEAYRTTRSEVAFAELVERHVSLVYRTALRQLSGNVHLAEDVTQEVFTQLAISAGRLAPDIIVAGWLYTTTRHAVSHAVRGGKRRQTREQKGYEMSELQREAIGDQEWGQLRPVLDDAMNALNARDRDVILLRFFEGLSFSEVGATLKLSEDAARVKLNRALEKLRDALATRGITSTATALATILLNQPLAAVPPTLAGAATTTALAAASATGGATIFAVAVGTTATLMIKKTALVLGVLLLLLTSGIAFYKTLKVRALEAHIALLRMDNLPAVPRSASKRTDEKAIATSGQASGERAVAGVRAPVFEQIRNAGRDTPEAAYVTGIWAMQQGDVKLLAESSVLDDDARAILQKVFDELPAEARHFYGSIEVMSAALTCYMNKTPLAVEIVGKKENGPDAVMLTYHRGEDRSERFIPLVRADDGWKVVARGVILMDRTRIKALMSAAEELASKGGESRVTMPAPASTK